MTRNEIAARIRTESQALLKATDAHIVVTVVIGADGGVTECSSAMDTQQTAHIVRSLTIAGRLAIADINAGNVPDFT